MTTITGAASSLVDPGMVVRYTRMLFEGCSHFVPVRLLPEKGGAAASTRLPFFETGASLEENMIRAAFAADQAGLAMYVVPGTVREAGSARATDVVQTQVLPVDLDHGDIAAKREHLEQHLGRATLVVASGGVTAEGQRKLHLYWRMADLVEGEGLAQVAKLRRMIASKVGGDPAFRSMHQPIRVAGSVYRKGGQPRLVEILHCEAQDA